MRDPDVEEHVRQARVVEINRRVEHCGVPGLQMVCDDTCRGVPDLRRREQGLLTVDALDGVDHAVAVSLLYCATIRSGDEEVNALTARPQRTWS